MSIVYTPENHSSYIDRKLDMRKVRTSSIKSSSTLLSCLICEMYNRVNRAQNKRLTLKSYIPENNTSIFPKKHYDNIFS